LKDLIEIVIFRVGFYDLIPFDHPIAIAEAVDKILCQNIRNCTFFFVIQIVVFLGMKTDWFNDIQIQILVPADESPEILANNFQITTFMKYGFGFSITDAQNTLDIFYMS